MPTTIVWFRRDLRVHDLPALATAAAEGRVVPLFVFDDRLLDPRRRWGSGPRTGWMLGCLADLDEQLRRRGGRLFVRHGRPETVLAGLAREVGATDVRFTADVSPFARRRDGRVRAALEAQGVRVHAMAGAGVVDDPAQIVTQKGTPFTVFAPYKRAWLKAERRRFDPAPNTLHVPPDLDPGALPTLADLGLSDDGVDLGPDSAFPPGEGAGRKRLDDFLSSGALDGYRETRNDPAGGGSRLSPYLRWGCVSPLELDARVVAYGSDGANRYRDEIAWRDFYAAVLVHFPDVTEHAWQERYRALQWDRDDALLQAWKDGRTGYPLVDAGMRQLRAEGWMPNRVRMTVGSFLTKDLHQDWQAGEAWFMRWLLDGDVAANNGNWQWVASVGTDPAPYFQRLFNPVLQQEKFDPDGVYVRRWVPELAHVETQHLAMPWEMTEIDQGLAGCVIGTDYPAPIVDHKAERERAIERYRAAAATAGSGSNSGSGAGARTGA
ncbi:MAG TPA: deoxyribodipyrimidine photo-lyase, partial [Solirubrobacteraceae bacterium]|nr:deoxyribodipyrimidine photo-lyase [Solirubrobacteraceae bacterium]